MRVFLLADGGSPHTMKWAKSLAQSGYDIFIFGLSSFSPDIYKNEPRIQTFSFGLESRLTRSGNGSLRKVRYLKAIFKLRKCIAEFKPDIVHVHFVSSYGLLGSLISFPKLFMSVWGADVYDFPERSLIHKRLLEFTLKKATALFSTSEVMAKQTSKFTDKPVEVVPFGIDLNKFKPFKPTKRIFTEEHLVIGTVKSLEQKYGISDLIDAFSLVKMQIPELKPKLLIVGKGSLENLYKQQVQKLNLEADVHFTGWINVEEVPDYHNQLDISVFPSILDSESFGVAVVEASACEKPVIVSRKGGLIEVVEENVSGLVVPPQDPEALAKAILKLAGSAELRLQLGKAGRERVKKLYNWDNNLKSMIEFYERV